VRQGDNVTFDEELMRDGLELSLIGMGVVFAVLSVLAIFIKAFDLVDARIPAGDTPSIASSGSSAQISTPPSPAPAIPEPDAAETAAVIAVALALSDAGRRTSASPGRPPASGSWVSTGRSREMSSRMIGSPRRGLRNS
jgi:sodium pump decarboxylase gamma subunit